ncbi:hypothetical protein [Cupriavidus sp. TMH.W2]|uniref:hypothetical protein n=1 Tax=Cupriavidus sp. TMH.W2 TaxID=3434465 RepID=UPI003D77F20C
MTDKRESSLLAVGDLVELVAAPDETIRGAQPPAPGDRGIIVSHYGNDCRVVCGTYPALRWEALCAVPALRLVARLGREEALRRLEPDAAARRSSREAAARAANDAFLAAARRSGVTVERAGGGWLVKSEDTVVVDEHGAMAFFAELEPTLEMLARQGLTACRVEFAALCPEGVAVPPTVAYVGQA